MIKIGRNIAKKVGFRNSLIINQLDKTTKIITKMFGSSTYFSYLYIYQTTKRYGLPS
jgi:hypothetical protein